MKCIIGTPLLAMPFSVDVLATGGNIWIDTITGIITVSTPEGYLSHE
ncbi:MAG: hypothetical protein HOK52_04840 [Candidatus Marinimicrobia bacterium]|nr:hypothetical protein [Candidatus Neomarinimicrobiota bacterium]